MPGNAGNANDIGGSPTVSDVLRRHADEITSAPRPRAPVAPAAPANAAIQEVKIAEDGTLFLSKSGNLVSTEGLDRPRDAIDMGDTLYRASARAEDGENIFASPKIALEQKALAMTSLVAAFNSANADLPGMGGFQNKEQALQVRSCVAALLLDLAESLSKDKPAEAELKKKIVQQYLKLLESEPHGLARNFMIYDLDRTKAKLPAEFHGVIDTLMNEVAPLNPFYDEWFKNGNTTLKVDYHVGNGFWEEEVQFWIDQGFARRDNGDGTLTLSKDLVANGVATKVEMRMYNGPESIFRKMNDLKTHLVVYSGHANYGRTVTKRLEGGTPLIGNKVFFGLQCVGKGIHRAILEKYPDLQVVQSKNSSYPNEDRNTLLIALEGMAARQGWEAISKRNGRENSSNYYFPTDTLINKRAEDQDGDGIADAWDRVVSYNRFRPQAAVNEQLIPRDPGRGAHELDGRNLAGAIHRFGRIAGYNEWAQDLQDQRVLSNGFYEGRPEDPILKIKEIRDAEGTIYQVEVNKCYAHASEETLGAILCYEIGRAENERRGQRASDAKASALLMVAKCLDVDDGGLDDEIWRSVIAFEKLPANISYSDALSSAKQDHHMSAGTRQTVAAFNEKLRARGIQL